MVCCHLQNKQTAPSTSGCAYPAAAPWDKSRHFDHKGGAHEGAIFAKSIYWLFM